MRLHKKGYDYDFDQIVITAANTIDSQALKAVLKLHQACIAKQIYIGEQVADLVDSHGALQAVRALLEHPEILIAIGCSQ